jgi:hypothetical protein
VLWAAECQSMLSTPQNKLETHYNYPLTLYFKPDTKIFRLVTGEKKWGGIEEVFGLRLSDYWLSSLPADRSSIPEKRFPINLLYLSQ